MPGILLATAYLALFLLAVHKLHFFDGPGLGKRFLMIVLALKVLAGTGVWWLYTYHYTNRSDGDIYKFFDSSAVMYDALWTNPGDFLRMLLGIANDNGYFLKGVWNFSKAVLRPMMKNENGGSIFNITSISGVVGMLGQSNYAASKAGMIGLTKSLEKEVASRKITVNALALGLIETEMASEMNAEYREKILAQIPLGRLGNTQEVAEIALSAF